MMLHQESIKQLISGVSMGGYSLYTSVNIKSIVKLANTYYHYLCTSGSFNVPTPSFNTCFNCYAPKHGVDIFPHNKDQKNILENKKKLIEMKQIQGGSGGGKTWAKHSNKKGWDNKPQNK